MKKTILILACMSLICSMSFAAKKRVMVNGKPKMLEVVEEISYREDGKVSKILDSDGNYKTYEYNANGDPLKDEKGYEITYDEAGRVTKKFGEYDFEYYEYDKNGKLEYCGSESKEDSWNVDKREGKYYKDGILIKYIPRYSDNKIVYDYYSNGLIKSEKKLSLWGDNFLNYTIDYEYNNKNQLIKKTHKDFANSQENPEISEIKYEYDDNGNCIYIEDLVNGSSMAEFDENNRKIYEWKEGEYGDEFETYWEYDDKGNITAIKRPAESGEGDYSEDGLFATNIYVYEYDENDVLRKYEEKERRCNMYDGFVEESSSKEWNEKGLLTKEVKDDHTYTYEYNDKGLVAKITDSYKYYGNVKEETNIYVYEYYDNGKVSKRSEYKL